MLGFRSEALALLLAAVSCATAARIGSMRNDGNIAYQPAYAGMDSHHRAARNAAPPELPGFPAHRVKRHEFGLHKRQTSDSSADLDLVAAQSWYWGDGKSTSG